MRTNFDPDGDLIAQASRLAKVRSEREPVHLALKKFVENHQRNNVLELVGKVQYPKQRAGLVCMDRLISDKSNGVLGALALVDMTMRRPRRNYSVQFKALYYQPVGTPAQALALMRHIDE